MEVCVCYLLATGATDVPSDVVALRRKGLVDKRFDLEEEVVSRSPLLWREVERRRRMALWNDDPATWKDRLTVDCIPRGVRAVGAQLVLQVLVGGSQSGEITKWAGT